MIALSKRRKCFMSFYYSLRFMLDPYNPSKDKINKLLQFVQHADIDNVCFFISGEELNHGHLISSEIDQWLKLIQPISQDLAHLGVSTSLNPWTTIMHSDRGFKINPELKFRPFVDLDGNYAQSMACPADINWVNYISSCYAKYATLKPKELWLEDDFRHFNHSPLNLMCFCDYHMQLYQEKLGYKISRTAFVNQLISNKPSQARKIYLQQARQEMIFAANQIEKAVHRISPNTNLALMTSDPNWHAIEGRDWEKLLKALAGKNHPIIIRPHLPAYNEISPLKYGRLLEYYTRATCSNLPEAVILPELENYMYSPLVKSNKFIKFQLMTTAMFGASGIFLNLFDMLGNGINNTWNYAKLLKDAKPFLKQLAKTNFNLNSLNGIKILTNQNSVYHLQNYYSKDINALLPHETGWSFISDLGFATTIIANKNKFQNETLAISGQFLENLTNTEIKNLIKNNTVLLDGECVQVLIHRKLQYLINIDNVEIYRPRTAYQAYEVADNQIIDNIKNPRMTMQQHIGNYYQISYINSNKVHTITTVRNYRGQILGKGIAIIDNHIIILPTDYNPKYGWEAQYSTIKQGIFQAILDIPHLQQMPGVKLNCRDNYYLISNWSLDDYSKIKISTKIRAKKLTIYSQKGNNTFKRDNINNAYVIPYHLKGLETICIKFTD